MLYNECLESIFIEISFDENKKKYCWSYLPASPYASFTKTASKQYHFKVFRSNDFLFFFVLYIQPPTHVVGSPATLIDNIFMNSVAIPFP